jgi:hypothetical protein
MELAIALAVFALMLLSLGIGWVARSLTEDDTREMER